MPSAPRYRAQARAGPGGRARLGADPTGAIPPAQAAERVGIIGIPGPAASPSGPPAGIRPASGPARVVVRGTSSNGR